MGEVTKGHRLALEATEQILQKGGYPADDPGLRDRFADLPRAPIEIICCGLDKTINHGNILRIADCFRLKRVTFAPVGRKKEKDFSGGFAALHWQPYLWLDTAEAVQNAKSEGARIYGLSLEPNSQSIREVKWQFPSAIVLGQELKGIDEEVKSLCDEFIGIPLYGMIQSLNVAIACGIAVESAMSKFISSEPNFQPARKASQNLKKQ